jgi:hypothetical protein
MPELPRGIARQQRGVGLPKSCPKLSLWLHFSALSCNCLRVLNH